VVDEQTDICRGDYGAVIVTDVRRRGETITSIIEVYDQRNTQSEGPSKAVYPYMAAYVSIWKDTVAHVDVVI